MPMSTRKIVAKYDPPPIPDRRFDWYAYDEVTADENGPCGYGPTRVDAIRDLLWQIDEPALLRPQAG